MKVGIPLEIQSNESRVGATPKTVLRLIKQGFEVFIEKGAGTKANYSDLSFEQAGATIIDGAAALYQKADIILKVLAPQQAV